MVDTISTLVVEGLHEGVDRYPNKYRGTLAAANGCIYGIPYSARRVLKFNPVDNSIINIGPNFDRGYKWGRGAITGSGVIYCLPCERRRGILKIDTNTDTVIELDVNLLPERGHNMWLSCAVALDGCIYCMPYKGRRIMKIDPKNNDAMTSVGDDLGDGRCKYSGTVVGIDGCVYGIPTCSTRIVKYDPINDVIFFVGEETDKYFKCSGGALGRDGFIYALANDGRVLKIDTTNNSHGFVGNSIQSDNRQKGWSDAILGIDGCIYGVPYHTRSILRYDPHSNQISFLDYEFELQNYKWFGGALAIDGVIYCIPDNHHHVLAIDPIEELFEITKAIIHEHPEEFGSLFQTIEVDGDSLLSLTNFDLAVIKFGPSKVFEALEKSMKPINDFCNESNLCPFMIAASYKESRVCVINHLLRRDLSWVNNCISSWKGNEPKNKKSRIK